MAMAYYEEDPETGMPRLVKKAPAPAPAPAPTGIINQAAAPTGFAGVQGTPAPAPAPVVSKPAPAPTGELIQKAAAPTPFAGVQGAVTTAPPPAPAVTSGYSAPTNNMVSKKNGVTYTSGGGNFATPAQAKLNLLHQISMDGSRRDEYAQWQQQTGGKIDWASPEMQGLLNQAKTDPKIKEQLSQWAHQNPIFGQDQALKDIGIDTTAYWAAQKSQSNYGNAGGFQGIQGPVPGAAPVAGPPAPGPSGTPMTRPFTPDGAGSSTNASGTSGFREWNVTAPQTVQSQANDIIAADSPLMQQARGRAMQQMNERGLINSSLAVQAGQDAVMDRALQIAAPDAATNAQAAQFNANQGNAWNLAQQEMAQRDKQFAADMEYKRWALSQNFENEKQLREVEMKYNTELKSDEGFQRQYNTYIDGIFQIDMNKDLDPETKLQMKKQLGQQLDDYVTINKLGINMDFSDYWAAKAPPPPEEKPKVDPGTGNTGGAVGLLGYSEL